MAKLLVPDDLSAVIAPLLPPERPRPNGGRPPIPDRAALTGILFVLRTGLSLKYLPTEMGCGWGMSCWRRLHQWHKAGVWTAPAYPPKGGDEVGPNPTDRGKPGTKRHLVVGARGTPLGVTLSGANRHDSMALAATLDAIPPVRSGKRGRPRRRPGKLHADKAYDHRRCRCKCRQRGVMPRIARRGVDSSQKLGRHRWLVERTFAWPGRFRRLTVRYERRADTFILPSLRPAAPSSA